MDEHKHKTERNNKEALTRRAELPRDEDDDPEAEEETRDLAAQGQEDIGAQTGRCDVQRGGDFAHV